MRTNENVREMCNKLEYYVDQSSLFPAEEKYYRKNVETEQNLCATRRSSA